MKKIKSIGFIGLGLIGGSIARLLRAQDASLDLFAYDHHRDAPAAGLCLALSEGVLDRITNEISSFSGADLIFLCAPVSKNIEYLAALKEVISADCILTDVGSVKGNIEAAAKGLGLSRQFIGGHPMAGSEQTGYANSNTMLLENAYYILTPTADTLSWVRDHMVRLVEGFRAIPVVLDAKRHDTLTAAVSHLPHIIAAQLVNLVRNSDDEREQMRMLAAGGFKDITRIASSSPAMWQAICLSNADSIVEILTRYIESLEEVRNAVTARDADYFYRMFEAAGTYRASIPNGKGLLNRFYEIFIDISDEAGAIATIATLLGANGISIKNIGIIHNREFEQGVLRIEFYDEEALQKGKRLLSGHNYTLYERG